MSMMEHICLAPGCQFSIEDNTALGKPCPKHGMEYIRHHYDDDPAVDMWGWAKGGCHDEDLEDLVGSWI